MLSPGCWESGWHSSWGGDGRACCTETWIAQHGQQLDDHSPSSRPAIPSKRTLDGPGHRNEVGGHTVFAQGIFLWSLEYYEALGDPCRTLPCLCCWRAPSLGWDASLIWRPPRHGRYTGGNAVRTPHGGHPSAVWRSWTHCWWIGVHCQS